MRVFFFYRGGGNREGGENRGVSGKMIPGFSKKSKVPLGIFNCKKDFNKC